MKYLINFWIYRETSNYVEDTTKSKLIFEYTMAKLKGNLRKSFWNSKQTIFSSSRFYYIISFSFYVPPSFLSEKFGSFQKTKLSLKRINVLNYINFIIFFLKKKYVPGLFEWKCSFRHSCIVLHFDTIFSSSPWFVRDAV